jgi:hypothetical protein
VRQAGKVPLLVERPQADAFVGLAADFFKRPAPQRCQRDGDPLVIGGNVKVGEEGGLSACMLGIVGHKESSQNGIYVY